MPSNQGTRSPGPHHNNVGDYLESEVVRERKHNNFKAPLFKLARKIKSLIQLIGVSRPEFTTSHPALGILAEDRTKNQEMIEML